MSTEVAAINRFLAESVMGWKTPYKWSTDPHDGEDIPWDPVKYFEQCEPLLNQIELDWEWAWSIEVETYWFNMWQKHEPYAHVKMHGDTRTAALCRAIAKAYGWKDE